MSEATQAQPRPESPPMPPPRAPEPPPTATAVSGAPIPNFGYAQPTQVIVTGNAPPRAGFFKRLAGGLLTYWFLQASLRIVFSGVPVWIFTIMAAILAVFGWEVRPPKGVQDGLHHIKEVVEKRIDHGKEAAGKLAAKIAEEARERERKAAERLKAVKDKASDVKDSVAEKMSMAKAVASLLPKPSMPSFGGFAKIDPHAGERYVGKKLCDGKWVDMYVSDPVVPAPPSESDKAMAERQHERDLREATARAEHEKWMREQWKSVAETPAPPPLDYPSTYSMPQGYGGYYNGRPPVAAPEPLPDALPPGN